MPRDVSWAEGEFHGFEQLVLRVGLRRFAGQLAFSLGQDNERPQDDQQRDRILGQADIRCLPGIVLLEHGGLLFAGQRNRNMRSKRLGQQAQAAGSEPRFDFVAEAGIDQQAAHVGIVARQIAKREQAGYQTGGEISVHAGDLSLFSCGRMRPALIRAISPRPTACKSSPHCSVSGRSASGASSGPMLVSPIKASSDRR